MGTYIVTGAGSGIGAQTKRQLENDGHKVVSVDLKNADIVADLSSETGRQEALKNIISASGGVIDGLIPCAGVGANIPNGPLITEVNYYGATELVAGLKDQLSACKASVVLISSNSAPHDTDLNYVDALLAGNRDEALTMSQDMNAQNVYSGSKQALARWMRHNVANLTAAGIRVNAVAPGYTETAMTAAVAKDPTYGEAIKQFVKTIPVGRAGQPEDIANLIQFLLGPESSFICGSMIYVDGGHDAVGRPDSI